MSKSLKDYMDPVTRNKLGDLPTYHHNCLWASTRPGSTPVARPGKTARDRAKRLRREG